VALDEIANPVFRMVRRCKSCENLSEHVRRDVLMHFGPSAIQVRSYLVGRGNLGQCVKDARIPFQEWVFISSQDDRLILCASKGREADDCKLTVPVRLCCNDPQVGTLSFVVQWKKECLAGVKAHALTLPG
jgi:hypothetical protein